MIDCPTCGGDSTVLETRRTADNEARRRRVCKACKWRFSTVEQLVATGRPPRTGSTATIARKDLEQISRIVTNALCELQTGRDPTHGSS